MAVQESPSCREVVLTSVGTRPGKRRNSLRHRSHGPVEIYRDLPIQIATGGSFQ